VADQSTLKARTQGKNICPALLRNPLAVRLVRLTLVFTPDQDTVTTTDANGAKEPTETDALVADTDGDGWSDGDEVSAGTDPLKENSYPGAVAVPAAGATHLAAAALALLGLRSLTVRVFKPRTAPPKNPSWAALNPIHCRFGVSKGDGWRHRHWGPLGSTGAEHAGQGRLV
jgi:hypothetical protein